MLAQTKAKPINSGSVYGFEKEIQGDHIPFKGTVMWKPTYSSWSS
jgi:hypothetical protein